MFSTMKEGSVRAAIILLAVCGIGPSLYAFHNPMNNIGIYTCIIFSIVVLQLYLLTVDIWNYAMTLQPKSHNLSHMVYLNGGKVCQVLHDSTMNLLIFIGVISSEISISKLLNLLVGNFFFDMFNVPTVERTFEKFNNYAIFLVAFVLSLLFLKKDLSAFQSVSQYSIIILLFIVAVIIYQAPIMFRHL